MSEPLSGVVVAAVPDGLPAVPAVPPDPRPYVAYMAKLKSPLSRQAMSGCLHRIAAILGSENAAEAPWHALRYEHTSVIRAVIMDTDWSPSHKNKHLSALRGVIRQSWKLGLISAEERDRATDLESDDGTRLPAGRSIAGAEMAALLDSCRADGAAPIGIRDAALLTLLYRTGVRREEAARALIERYDPARRALRIIGKRDKEREVYVPEDWAPLFERWLVVVSARRGPVFRPVDRWGNIASRPMSTRAVGRVVEQRQAAAGLQHLTTHDFRRTFGGDFLDAGGDLVYLQKLMGHASATTTAAYDRREEAALRTAVDKLRMPAAGLAQGMPPA